MLSSCSQFCAYLLCISFEWFPFGVFLIFPLRTPVYAQEDVDAVDTSAESDDIDDILDATIEEPEEADDDINYEADEEEPLAIKPLRLFTHPLTDIPEPSSDIEVSYKVLSGKPCGGQIMYVEDYALAEPIRVIVNLKNNGVTVYNVTDCMGSLNDVDDFSHYRQNVFHSL